MKYLPLMLLLAAVCGCARCDPTPESIPPMPAQPELPASIQPGPGTGAPAAKPTPAGVEYQGGDGSTVEKAIVIAGARGEDDGVASEYSWLRKNYPGYRMRQQGLMQVNGKHYDRLDFTTAQGEARFVYFDITGFFGK